MLKSSHGAEERSDTGGAEDVPASSDFRRAERAPARSAVHTGRASPERRRAGEAERLVVVSNRVPSLTEDTTDGTGTSNQVGGLVSALHPAMADQGGVWFGWSGRTTQRRPNPSPTISQIGPVQMATVDLSEDDVSLYYTGFSNRTLWPLLHSFQDRVQIRHDTYRAYRRINRRFAEALYQLLGSDDLVWVHDYHLFNVGEALRQVGWRGKTGFFLHVPFPPTEIFSMLPWTRQILEGLLRYDVVGVQTERYLHNLIDTLDTELGGAFVDGAYVRDGKSTKLGVYRIGIEPASFERPAAAVGRSLADRLSLQSSPDHKTMVGVDRLDYTKGIPERLRAFERLLERVPALRGRVTLVQITAPSRTRVPEYNSEKERVERLVGQINGRFSEAEWVPIRYLYRSFPHSELARLYRESDVCMVTPLRDGMNLVAKEFIASQGDDPGVLVLSKFCGAADSMEEALQVNPYDIDGTAEVTHEALRMPAPERRRRWKALMKGVRQDTAQAWSNAFRSDLAN